MQKDNHTDIDVEKAMGRKGEIKRDEGSQRNREREREREGGRERETERERERRLDRGRSWRGAGSKEGFTHQKIRVDSV